MSIKRRFRAGGVVLTLALAVSVAAPLAGSAATPSCGVACYSLYSQDYGTGYIPAVKNGTSSTGEAIDLAASSDSNSAEDWYPDQIATVGALEEAGLVSSGLDQNYGNDMAYELQYAPRGAESGLCMGVASTAADNTAVTLQACGVTSGTLWIVDGADVSGGYLPLINGSDTNFSTPYVLEAGSSATSALITYTLQVTNSTVATSQMWNAGLGELP
jgi:hypothetical protein